MKILKCIPTLVIFVFLLLGQDAYAQDISVARSGIVKLRKDLEAIYEGGQLYKVRREALCSMTSRGGYFLAQEQGRLKYDDIFHEIQGDEQKNDIIELGNNLKSRENCNSNVKLWLEYDDKWYAPKRNSVIAAQKEAETKLLENLHDTGKDVWDGIINGQLLAVPRKYMWFGSNREDGVSDGINLLLPFKTKQGVEISVAAVLEAGFIEKKPCIGFKEPICTRESMQTPFTASYLACTSPGISGKETYKAMWRRECSFREELNTRQETLQPIFDKELSMWRIGQAGYYEGTPEFPDYFLICGKPDTSWHSHSKNPRCTSGAQIGESLNIYYTFPQRDGFWDHREINKMVVDTVTGFLVK